MNQALTRPFAAGARPRADVRRLATDRWPTIALLTAMVTIVLLSLAAQPRRTGDAHQYLAMAWQLSQARAPSLAPADAAALDAWLTAQSAESGFPDGARAVRQPSLVRDGRQEFSHFWFYPLLTAPLLRLTNTTGVHPILAFTAINATLLAVAVWATSRAFGPLAAFAIVGSPLVWFVARAQIEVFTISLLCLAMAAAAQGRWGWSSIAMAIASTQNLPIAALLPLIWIVAALDGRPFKRGKPSLDSSPSRRRTAATFVLASTAIALIHPAYYLWRLGVISPQQLNGGILGAVPSLQRYLAPIVDPDIGFLAWMPVASLLGLIGAALSIRAAMARRDWSSRDLLLIASAAAMSLWLLFAFAQTTNVNSGGTVHVSRYALWLLPPALPAIAVTTRQIERRWPVAGSVAAAALFLFYAAVFRPDQPERYVEHSPQAAWIMANVPALYAPLPEIFVERTLHIDGGPRASAAAPNCSLIFLLADQPDQPCPLSPNEWTAAQAHFARDVAAIWVRRGAGDSTISPALP